jgi:hypothetical protein
MRESQNLKIGSSSYADLGLPVKAKKNWIKISLDYPFYFWKTNYLQLQPQRILRTNICIHAQKVPKIVHIDKINYF